MRILCFRIFLFFVTLTFNTPSFGQTHTSQIKSISKEFQAINSVASLKKVSLQNEAFLEDVPDGGGSLSGFYKAGKIRKIYLWLGLSNGIKIKEFYFKDGQLIFGYEKFNSFVYDKKKDQCDFSRTETTFQGRYYFNNKKLLDYVTTGHNRFEDDSIDPEKTWISEANENLKLLSKKRQN